MLPRHSIHKRGGAMLAIVEGFVLLESADEAAKVSRTEKHWSDQRF